jgi:hypothetical protein
MQAGNMALAVAGKFSANSETKKAGQLTGPSKTTRKSAKSQVKITCFSYVTAL